MRSSSRLLHIRQRVEWWACVAHVNSACSLTEIVRMENRVISRENVRILQDLICRCYSTVRASVKSKKHIKIQFNSINIDPIAVCWAAACCRCSHVHLFWLKSDVHASTKRNFPIHFIYLCRLFSVIIILSMSAGRAGSVRRGMCDAEWMDCNCDWTWEKCNWCSLCFMAANGSGAGAGACHFTWAIIIRIVRLCRGDNFN